MRAYYNNNKNREWMKEETVFHHLSKKSQFLILSTFFFITIAELSLVIFSNGCFFHQNALKQCSKPVKTHIQ